MKKKKRAMMAAIRENIENKQKKSVEIANTVVNLDQIQDADCIACFISFRSEVDTWPLIEQLWSLGKQVVVPKVIEDMMIFYPIAPETAYRISPLGIREPINVHPIDPSTIKCAIIPGLAFDTSGHRLGYGGGFYDKFLSVHQPLKIAVAYKEQIINDVPYDQHDQIMDIIVTDKNIIDVKEAIRIE